MILLEQEPRQIVGEPRAIIGRQLQVEPESTRCRLLERPLVHHPLVSEMDAEAAGSLASPARKSCHCTGIDTTAEKRPDRHVRHELIGDYGGEHGAQLVDGVIIGWPSAELRHGPVRRMLPATAVDEHTFAGTELANSAKESPLRDRRVEVQVLVQRLAVEFAGYLRALDECFHLAREEKAPAIVVEVELLHAERIAREQKPPRPGIPIGESEDPDEIGKHVGATSFQETQQRLGVGSTPESGGPGGCTTRRCT